MEEMGFMRTTTGRLALLLTMGVALALAPTGVRAQDADTRTAPAGVRAQVADIWQAPLLVRAQDADTDAPSDPEIPLPIGHQHMEKGGFYAAGEFLFFRQTDPLKNQVIAVRGLLDFDGSITADLNGTLVNPNTGTPVIIPGQAKPGTFIGSMATALSAQDVGPSSYEPGWRLTLGWKFASGIALDFSWMSLVENKYAAVATLVPPSLNPGPILADSFLFSPVYNFPNDFAGPPNKLAIGNPNAAYGIWNAASVMSIQFVQRFTEYDINSRIPIFETDYCRTYGLLGFRHVDMWENFSWRTVAEDFNGQADQTDVAIYNNIVSNQMYGPTIGFGTEMYLSHGFSISADLREATMIDFVREIAKYYRADFVTQSKRSKKDYTIVPELDGQFNVWWYPASGIQVRVGYDLMTFFNTISSPDPVSFNYGGLDPQYKSTFRYFDGFQAGIGFIF